MARDPRLENQECLECLKKGQNGKLINTDVRDPGTRQLIYSCNYCGRQYTYDEWFSEYEAVTRPEVPHSPEEAEKNVRRLISDLKKREGEPINQEEAKRNIKDLFSRLGRRKDEPHDPKEAEKKIKQMYADLGRKENLSANPDARERINEMMEGMGRSPGTLVIRGFYDDAPIVDDAFISRAEPKNQLYSLGIQLVGKTLPTRPVEVPVGKYTITIEYTTPSGSVLEKTKSAIVKSQEITILDFNFSSSDKPPKITGPHPHGGSGPGNIHGHVTDADGNPLQDANVYLLGGDLVNYNAITDHLGYYRIDVGNLKGEFRVAVNLYGYKTKIKKLQRARQDKYQICDFKLNPSEGAPAPPTPPGAPTPPGTPTPPTPYRGEIWGYVTDSKKDTPIRGATITLPQILGPGGPLSSTTGNDGYYIIRNVNRRGATRVVARANNYSQATQTISRAHPDESSQADFKLVRSGRVPVPDRVAVGLGVNFNRLVGSIISIIMGLIVSSLLGNPYFFFGFLLFGASILMPNAEDLHTVQRLMRAIRQRNSGRINWIQQSNIPDADKIRQINEIVQTEVNSLNVERLLIGMHRDDSFRVNGTLILKHLFKAAGILSFVLAFVNTGLPFSNILALIGAFVGYFAMGGYRLPTQQTTTPATPPAS